MATVIHSAHTGSLSGVSTVLGTMETTSQYLKPSKTKDQNKAKITENQDSGVARHTAPPCTTRTDRKSKGKEVRHQGDKKETFIQTGRRSGDGSRGREDSGGVVGPRLAECGTKGAGSLTTSRPCGPTFSYR